MTREVSRSTKEGLATFEPAFKRKTIWPIQSAISFNLIAQMQMSMQIKGESIFSIMNRTLFSKPTLAGCQKFKPKACSSTLKQQQNKSKMIAFSASSATNSNTKQVSTSSLAGDQEQAQFYPAILPPCSRYGSLITLSSK